MSATQPMGNTPIESNLIELKVPDLGDNHDVAIIEVFIRPGSTVAREEALLTLETDKATMEVPANAAGLIREVKVKVGDKVSTGTLIALAEALDMAVPATVPSPPAFPAEPPSPQATAAATSFMGTPDLDCELLVLGGGPGGYSAAFRAADLGLKVVLVERFATLGGVCLNVGCIPSKALLHNAAVIDEVKALAGHGIRYAAPDIDLDGLRGYKDKVVGKLTGGLSGMAKARKVTVIRGEGRFLDPHHLQVALSSEASREETGIVFTGEQQVLGFKQAIIAAGSRVVKLPFIPDDPRIFDSTGALELRAIPQNLLIIGGGIIGLEMGTVYSTLGARLDVVEMLDGLMQGADRDLVKVWQKMNAHRFDRILLGTKTVAVEAKPDGIWVRFEGPQAPADPQRYDAVLVAAGRAPNGKLIDADKAGVAVSERGFIAVDTQMRAIGLDGAVLPHIFAIGDVVGQPMLAHKAVHEGHVAAEVAAGEKSFFDARVIPGVAYTDPEVAWVGLTEEEAAKQGIAIEKSLFPWAASGRAIANGRDEGFTKLIFDATTHRLVGGALVGTHAGDMLGEICLAIEMGCDATDIGKTIHAHPTLGESIGMAAEAFEGHCTDLPPQRRK